MGLMEGIPVTGSLKISKSNGRGIDTHGGSGPLFNCVGNLCDTSGTVRSDGRLLTVCSCFALSVPKRERSRYLTIRLSSSSSLRHWSIPAICLSTKPFEIALKMWAPPTRHRTVVEQPKPPLRRSQLLCFGPCRELLCVPCRGPFFYICCNAYVSNASMLT